MVKFTASSPDGITLIGLGLEDENVRRMQAGQPVRVRLSDLGFIGAVGAINIVIFTGKDAATMRRDLAPMIGPETIVHEEPPATAAVDPHALNPGKPSTRVKKRN